VRYSTSAVNRVLESGTARKDKFSSAVEPVGLGHSVRELGLRSLMCVPFETGEPGRRGVLYVDSTASEREFTQPDLAFFNALSTQIATGSSPTTPSAPSRRRARA
jgi:GAF domain-containing protein